MKISILNMGSLSLLQLSLCFVGRAEFGGVQDPVDSIREVSRSLQSQFNSQKEIDRDSFYRSIKRLYELNEVIFKFGNNISDPNLLTECEEMRAIAWMNGWAVLGKLALEGKADDRPMLYTKDNDVLSLIVAVYNQMKHGNARYLNIKGSLLDGAMDWARSMKDRASFIIWERQKKLLSNSKPELSDPLLIRSLDDPSSYLPSSWPHGKTNSPTAGFHNCLIPSSEYLLGKPKDDPHQMVGGLQSVWSLVNLQLDTWHNWGANDSPKPATSPGLLPLAHWLSRISLDQDLDGMGTVGGNPTEERIRFNKLSKFLTFRDHISTTDSLRNIIRNMQTGRLVNPRISIAAVLRDLIDAATPIKKDDYNVDAAIWLRYIILLSFQGDGGLSLVGNGGNDLDKTWEVENLPETRFLLDESINHDEHISTFRWSGWPAGGSVTRLLWDLVSSLYRYEKIQFKLIANESSRTSNSLQSPDELIAQVNELRDIAEKKLNLDSALVWHQSNLTPQIIKRRMLQYPDERWNRSVTLEEQDRILTDYVYLSRRITATLRLHAVAAYMNKTGNLRTSGHLLSSLYGMSPLSECDLDAPPTKLFNVYEANVNALVDKIKHAVDARQVSAHLVQEYHLAFIEDGITTVEAEAAEFALDAADQALKMTAVLKQIDSLTISIARLNKEEKEKNVLADQAKQKAAGLRLALSTRARDLAAVQVEALKLALKEAEPLVADAKAKLVEAGERLRAHSRELRDAKRRQFVVSIITMATTVLGAALAPFTGGVSSIVAIAVNQAISLYEFASSSEWGDLPKVIANVQGIVSRSEQILITLKPVVPEINLTQKWADFSKVTQGLERQIQDASAAVESVHRILKGLNSLDQVRLVVGATCSGLQFKPEKGEIDLNLNACMTIQDQQLSSKLKAILLDGGVFVNNIPQRFRNLSVLPLLDNNEELKKKLTAAIDSIVRVAPKEVIDLYHRPEEEARSLVLKGKKALQQWISQANEKQAQLLGRILGGGMIIAVWKEEVVVLERPIQQESAEVKSRLEAVKSKVVSGALGNVVRAIRQQRVNLESQVSRANQDPDQIDAIANNVESLMTEISDSLDQLQDAITEAEGDLADRQTETDAASLEELASQLAEESSEIENTNAASYLTQSFRFREMTNYQEARDRDLARKAEEDYRAMQEKVLLSDEKLSFAYDNCAQRGIDPQDSSTMRQLPSMFGGASAPQMSGVMLFGYNDTTLERQVLLTELVREYVGMLRWMQMLRLKIPADPFDRAKGPTNAVAMYQKLLLDLSKNTKVEEEAEIIATDATKLKNLEFPDVVHPILDTYTSALHIYGNDEEISSERLLIGCSTEVRKQVIAKYRCLISDHSYPGDIERHVFERNNKDRIAIGSEVRLILKNKNDDAANLYYAVFPPKGPDYYESALLPGEQDRWTNQRLTDVEVLSYNSEVTNRILPVWRSNPLFLPLYGEWTVFIFDANRPATVPMGSRMKLEVELYIPFLVSEQMN
jgi:hypothetical protein